MRVSAAELESDQELDATRWRDTDWEEVEDHVNKHKVKAGGSAKPVTGASRASKELRDILVRLVEAVGGSRAEIETYRRKVLYARNHPLMTDADVEQPPGVRESRRLVTEFLGRLRMGLMDAERMGTAVGAALLGIHAEARASLVAGLVLLEEGPMLHYLQESYMAQRQVQEQRRNRRRLEEIMREVQGQERNMSV